MSHKPHAPQGAVSRYPHDAAQSAARADAKHELAEKAAVTAPIGRTRRWSGVAAGAAIGSAAIVAGMIYWNRQHD